MLLPSLAAAVLRLRNNRSKKSSLLTAHSSSQQLTAARRVLADRRRVDRAAARAWTGLRRPVPGPAEHGRRHRRLGQQRQESADGAAVAGPDALGRSHAAAARPDAGTREIRADQGTSPLCCAHCCAKLLCPSTVCPLLCPSTAVSVHWCHCYPFTVVPLSTTAGRRRCRRGL